MGGTALVAVCAASCLLNAMDQSKEIRFGFGTPSWHLAHLGFFEQLSAVGYWHVSEILHEGDIQLKEMLSYIVTFAEGASWTGIPQGASLMSIMEEHFSRASRTR